ncbi:DoxX family protein [Nocardia sp. CA-119907]|uniref:DoxX family protein n=1 Tax=Nocardia sp. CA-119907 TaxID=3239973 RepID=UPI003D952F24
MQPAARVGQSGRCFELSSSTGALTTIERCGSWPRGCQRAATGYPERDDRVGGPGVVEVAGGFALMVPRLSVLAAAGLSVLTVLAAGTQAFIADKPAMGIFPLVLAAIFAWIAHERRATITDLRNSLSR